MSHFTPKNAVSQVLSTGATAVSPGVSVGRTSVKVRDRAKVLHLINGEHYSGAERVQDLLGTRLPEMGFDVGFACLKPGKFPAMRECAQAKLHLVPMQGRFDLRAIWKLVKIVRHEKYALLHAHTPRTVMIGNAISRFTGVPLVYHVHSPTSRDSTRRVLNWINSATERLSLVGVQQLVTVSRSLASHMQTEGFGPELISVVPNGVPMSSSVRSSSPPSGRWTLGSVALFRPRKGLEVLLKAISRLRESGHDVRLRAVGPFETPEYEAEIHRLADRLLLADHIDWVGFTREVNAQFQQMDLFVLPSLFGEGLPMVVLEAMAAGVPVVGTRVEGVPEAIRDGVDGLIAEPGDDADLAATIGRVVRGEVNWSLMRENAQDSHAEHFSDFSMAAGVAQAYRRVLSSR
ncbi:MAG: glycosyltransferase [Pirellulaceae bacterium]|nr:glycosyltransferase [Planctomycetales bacterium]MCA9266120.1 glycosyltransferase [Planctomycetales bacterium]